MKKRLLLIGCSLMTFIGTGFLHAQKANIAWASEAITADSGYIATLENAGYTVHAVQNNWMNLPADSVAILDTFDLVIIAKRTNSVNYGSDATVRANWSSITTPVINMNNYVNRSSRLQFFNTTVNNDNVNKYMIVADTNHPIFTNIALNASDSTPMLTTENFQANNVLDAGNGTVLATDPATGTVTIAEWAGDTSFYTGSETPAGKRMFYSTSYNYSFTNYGAQLFLNAVEYMITGKVVDKNKIFFVTENYSADSLYIADLKDQGFTVSDVYMPKSVVTDVQKYIDSLNAGGLVIVSRNTSSGNYDNRALWNYVETPIITLSAYLARNNRWGIMESTSTTVAKDSTVIKVACDTNIALFDYITLGDDSLLTVLSTDGMEVADLTTVGNGTIIASSTRKLNKVAIAEWQANVPYYTGSTNTPLGKRLLLSLPGTNLLNVDGKQLFMNAVMYMMGRETVNLGVTNFAPTDINVSTLSIAENENAGTLIGTISAVDPNTDDTFTYSLVDGEGSSDNASFTISGNELLSAESFDFETKSGYSIRIQVSDGELTYSKAFTVTVTDVEEIVEGVSSTVASQFNVYPNPFINNLVITGSTDSEVAVKLMSINGQVIFEGNYQSGSTINISLKDELPAGVYYILIMNKNSQNIQKLIHQ
jgi:hypothetical protein